ncbi:AraC family transcriptional regulator [Paenibacillus sp. T3-5-0-4]|nr:AraC family transcriptional regulator [Paenibacillus endoradicis]
MEQEPRSLRNWKRQSVFQQFIQYMDRELTTSSDGTAIQLAEKIEIYIRQNYTQKINNASLQSALNYHSNYLSRCMLKVYGMTPMDYLLFYRMKQAKRLLLKTEWSITRIAEEIGFIHSAYFTACFSKKEGIAPLQFRKKLRGHL